MKHFVTGGYGFIGSHLVDTLLAEGHDVTAYDNLFTGRKSDLAHQEGNSKFLGLWQGDIRDSDYLTHSMVGHDVVWHLGASGNIPAGIADTNLDFSINTVGTRNVLEAMRTNKIRQILFSSTAAAYGDGAAKGVPLAETYGPLLPISLYAASKIAGEAMISAYSHLFGLQAWIFRFANCVGARMGHGVIFDLIQKIRQNPQEIDVWGTGDGRKPFVLVDDLLWGMIVAFRHCEKQCDVYNVGVSDTTKISEVVKIITEEMGLNPKLNFGSSIRGFPGDVPVVLFDPQKLAQYGWKARYGSTEAVRIAVKRLLTDSAPVPFPVPPAGQLLRPESFGPH